MLRRLVVVVVLGAAVFSVAQTPSGAEPTAEPGCREPDSREDWTVITEDVVLTRDLTCERLSWQLGPGVTVDLGMHRISVAQSRDCRRGLYRSCDLDLRGGTLRNGRIDGASFGVAGGSLEHLYLSGGDVGFNYPSKPPGAPMPPLSAVRNSVLDGSGVLLLGGATIERSWLVRGQGIAMSNTEGAIRGFVFRDNFILNNEGSGISNVSHVHFDDDVSGTIERNVIAGNTGAGIAFGGVVKSLGSIVISQNLLVGNGYSGIHIVGSPDSATLHGGPITITGNIALFNKANGINASAGIEGMAEVVDGGGNRAFGNASKPECIGVVCR